jgi:flagellar hook assembly protein FlgD
VAVALLGSGTSGDVPGETSGLSLELYRPTPNPFTNTTTIAYAVGGNGQDVQIGIYDVAGRLVRSLTSGFQAAGQYQVTWDGRGDNGASVSRGVYFLRALVGGERMAAGSRILYLR